MSSNTKMTGSLMSSVKTLGEWVLRNPSRTQMALANVRAGIGGVRANQLLPALQNGLASFTQASGLDLPNFDRFRELDASSSAGSLPDELREVVQGALPVAYALAGADGTTFSALQQINDLLKIKPIDTEMVPAEKLGSVGQSLRDVADDLRKIAKEEARKGNGTGTAASNGNGARGGVIGQVRKPGFRGGHYFKAATIPFVTTVTAEGGVPPYSVSVPTSLVTLTPVKHQPSAFVLKAFLPTNGEIESSVVVKLTDSNDESSDVVFVVDFSGAQPPASQGEGEPTLVRQGNGVLDAAKGSTQALEFIGEDLPADWVTVVTTGATPPTHLPSAEALVPFAFRAEPEEGDPADTLRLKLWIALSTLPSTGTLENLFVSIVSKGKIVATSQAQYVGLPVVAPRALGFASLQAGAGAPLPLDNAPQATVPVNAPSAVIAANVAGVVKGAVARLEKTGDPTKPPYEVGRALSTSPSLSLALGPDLLAHAGTYQLIIENPSAQRFAGAAPLAKGLAVVVGNPAVTSPKSATLASGGQTATIICFAGVNFLPESSTVAATAYDANDQEITIKAVAKITSPTEGEITLPPATKKPTRLTVRVTNKAISAGKDIASPEWPILLSEGPALPPRRGGGRDALTADLAAVLNGDGNQTDVLEQAKALLMKAGYQGFEGNKFDHRLLKLRKIDEEAQERQLRELLETLPHNV